MQGGHRLLEAGSEKEDALKGAEDVELNAQWVELPPMPEPDRQLRDAQAASGAVCVATSIALCVGLAYGVALRGTGPFTPGTQGYAIVTAALWVEAALALLCLARLLLFSPGLIERSPDTCSPLPEVPSHR